MKKIIGVCGALCHECPGFIATQNDDNELREKTAKEWSKLYNVELKADYINCDGCTVPGKKIGHCHECEIRKCGTERGVENCGHCKEYACEKLKEFFKIAPDNKKTLDKIKEDL